MFEVCSQYVRKTGPDKFLYSRSYMRTRHDYDDKFLLQSYVHCVTGSDYDDQYAREVVVCCRGSGGLLAREAREARFSRTDRTALLSFCLICEDCAWLARSRSSLRSCGLYLVCLVCGRRLARSLVELAKSAVYVA